MNKILKIFSKEFTNMNQAALLLGVFTLLSQVLALIRDRSLAHFIGPSAGLDAYYAAFRIPDLIFISIASLASITVLIPFIVAKMRGEEVTEEAKKFLNDVFTVFFLALILVAAIAFFLMPHLVFFIAPGFTHTMQMKVVWMSRIMLLSPIFMGLSNLFGTVTQLFRKFFIFSLSPVFYNLGIIFGIIILYPIFGIYGLAFGVVIGALLHMLIQVVAALVCGLSPKFSFSINFKDIRKAILTSFPRTIGLAMNSISLIVIVALASYLKSGSISIFNFSYNLQTVPLNIIGVSYAVAAFPTMAKSFTAGKMNEFKNHLRMAARQIIFWSLPITFLFVVLRAQIVRVLLGSGAFSWQDTRLASAALAVFSFSILAQSMIGLLSRSYYAGGKTTRPLIVNSICSVFIMVLSPLLLFCFNTFSVFRYFVESMLKVTDIPGTAILMLPLAYTIGTILNFILHWIFVKKDFLKDEAFIAKSFFQSLGASFFIGFISYLGLNAFSPIFGLTTFWGVFLQGFFSGSLGILAGFIVLYLLKNEELIDLIKTLKTKFWRVKVIVPSQEEL